MARKIGAAFALGLILVTSFVSVTQGAVPRTESRSYVGATGDLGGFCRPSGQTLLGTGLASGIGVVCFSLDGTESQVSLTVRDLSGLPVVAGYVFSNEFGGAVSDFVQFCNAASAPVPATAVSLEVYLAEAAGPLTGECGLYPGSATAGTVDAAFT